jgi:hypothetical protein
MTISFDFEALAYRELEDMGEEETNLDILTISYNQYK